MSRSKAMARKAIKPPRSKPVPIISARAGEGLFRFDARSVSRASLTHLVDLRDYWWNGGCGCEAFQMKYEPELARGAKPSDKLRCSHIKAARSFFLDEILPKIADSFEGKGNPPPSRELVSEIRAAVQVLVDNRKAKPGALVGELMALKDFIVGKLDEVLTPKGS